MKLNYYFSNHVLRDLTRGIIIEVEGADTKIVLAGVLLHDVCRLHLKREDHHASGAEIAPRYLAKAGLKKIKR